MLGMADALPQDWDRLRRPRQRLCAPENSEPQRLVPTALALFVWPCNCYRKDDKAEPDLLLDLDLYARRDLGDALAIIGPRKLVWTNLGPEAHVRPARVHARRRFT